MALRSPLKPKPYHMAKGIREDGAVSALCSRRPRRIDLTRASWTNRVEAVTCAKCLKIIGARTPKDAC